MNTKNILIMMVVIISSMVVAMASEETETLQAIQKEILIDEADWIAGTTSVSGLTQPEKQLLTLSDQIPAPDGMIVVAPAMRTLEYETRFDWRDEGAVTSVKSQGSCGSCWAFSAIGAIESAFLIFSQKIDIDLSEQHLVSSCCNAGSCSGGWPDWAFKYVRNAGVPDESCYPYTASNDDCNPCDGWENMSYNIKNYVYVKPTKDDFKWALKEYGPLSVVVFVPDDWYYYRSGIYEPVVDVGWANHAVLLVGWDDSDECWFIKNSWGLGWGEQGYARVKYGDLEQYNYAFAVTGVGRENEPPEAFASATPLSGNAPLTVTFTGSGNDSDGTIVSYKWVFGDGESSNAQNQSHVYTNPDTYTATLVATDDDGAIGINSVTIVVNESFNGSWVSPVDAIASSVYSTRLSADKAIDGSRYTHWIAKTYAGPPEWIQLDMGSINTVSKVRMWTLAYYRPITLDVHVSNDASRWMTVVSNFTIAKEDGVVEISFDQTNARYVRLWETAYCRNRGMCTEVEVFVGSDDDDDDLPPIINTTMEITYPDRIETTRLDDDVVSVALFQNGVQVWKWVADRNI